MNVIKIKIDFEKGLCQKEGISVVTGDYNSTKIEFEFNESAADGRKIFELKNSDDELVYVDEIVDNEVILVGKREEEGEEKLFSLFNKEGDYTFEVSLYGENSKLTSVYDYITARKEQVTVDDETVEQYMPLFDNLMQELSNKVAEADSKIDDIDQAIEDVNQAVQDAEEAVESTNNLNIDVNKVDKTTQVDLTKKDGTTKTVYINDGTSLQFMWQGTSLGIKTDDMEQYVFVDLQGIQGQPGPQGEPFRIKKEYASVAEMNADFDNMNVGDYVMIASTVEIEDNAKLYVKGDSQWIFITDFSGATGIKGETGATPIIRIGTVTSGSTPSVTISGTAEEPVFNFVLQPGQKGEKGDTGSKGDTGNGIASIVKTASAGLIDTYTITFTDGTTSTFNVTNGQDGEVTQEYVDEESERLKSVFNVLPKVSDGGESVTLENTGDTILYKIDLKGNTSQEVVSGEVGLEVEDTSIYVDDVNEDKEDYITLKGNTYQDTTSISGGDQYDSPSPDYPQEIEVVTGLNEVRVEGKNLCNGINQNVYLNTAVNQCGTNSADSGLYIPVTSNTYTISTKITQARYRVACSKNIPTPVPQTVYRGVNKDGTSNSITIDTTGYDYLIVNATDLTAIQIEKGSQATTYEPYKGQTYEVNLGKNLFNDYLTTTSALRGITVSGVDDGIKLNGTYSQGGAINLWITESNALTYDNITLLKANTKYTVSIRLVSGSMSNKNIDCAMYKRDATTKQFSWNGMSLVRNGDVWSKEYTPTTDIYIGAINFILQTTDTETFEDAIFHIQIEKGQLTNYSPYKTPIELCKIGTYQDRIYKNNGNWYLHKEIGKVVLDGSENWNKSGASTSSTNVFYTTLSPTGVENNALSNMFIYSTATQNNTFDFANYGANIRVKVSASLYPEASDFKTWLSSNNVIAYYPLETPTDTQITDTTLVNQLNALYNATIYSTTHINTETSNLLPYINLKYNVVTASPSPDRASEVEVVKGNNTITISNEDGTKTQSYNITLGNLELCKIGNYQDYFYKENGNWYKYNAIGKVVLNGSESWVFDKEQNNLYKYVWQRGLSDKKNFTPLLSNYFKYLTVSEGDQMNNIGIVNGSYEGWYSLQLITTVSTLADFKTWLSTHNTTCYYILATPTTTQITDQLLVSQLDELQKAMSYYDKTIITQTNADKPFILDVIGIRDLQDIFNLISGE